MNDPERKSPVEIELKYTSEDVAPLELVLSKEELAGFRLRKLPKQNVIDRYYDTSDQDLRRQGLALRIRQLGKKLLATVKSVGHSSDGLHRREEIEVNLSEASDPIRFADGPIQERIGPIIGDKTLEEICEIAQNRRRRLLSCDQVESMELSVDEVTLTKRGETKTFFEMESELLTGGREEDLLLLKEFFEELSLQPVLDTKLERALEFMGRENQERSGPSDRKKFGLEGDDTLHRGFAKILRFYYRRFLKYEKAVRKNKDIEALHSMRVAGRRIRSAIFLFRPYLKDSSIKEIERGTRRAIQELGAVRDFDVLLLKLSLYSEEQKKEVKTDLEILADYWSNRREKARKDLIRYLEGSKFRKLREDFRVFFKDVPNDDGTNRKKNVHPEKKVRHVIPAMVWKAYEEVRKFETAMPGASNQIFHDLRIESKRLRYTLEMFSQVLGDGSTEVIQPVVRLQEHLGILQDSDVTAELLKNFLDDPGKKRKQQIGPSVEKTLKAYRRHLEKIQRHQSWSFDEVWEPVAGSDFRKRLSDLLLNL